MITSDRMPWRDEMAWQRQRLDADLAARQLGIAATCAVFSFFLPFWYVFLTYLLLIGCEMTQQSLLRRLVEGAEPAGRRAVFVVAVAELTTYSMPSLFLWLNPDPLAKLTGVAALIGALLHVAVVRSAYLPFGLWSGLPPALALLWLPGQYLFDPTITANAALAATGVTALLAYFLAALVHNYRAQAELVSARNEARSASWTKSLFLTALGQEIGAPLATILGQSAALRSNGGTAPGEAAAAIETAARQIALLVGDAADLAAATEGEIRFRPVTALIRSELSSIAEALAPLAGPALPAIVVEIAPEVPEAGRFDPLLLRKCLLHLCLIVLAEQTGRPARAVTLRCALAPGRTDRLRLTVAGLAPDQGRLAPEAEPGEGSLAQRVLYSLSAVMGARAALQRAPDCTLVGRIELPFVPLSDPPESGAATVYGRLRALVVDSAEASRFALVQHLRALQIEAGEATSGEDALVKLADEKFDCVLVDMNMPGMDGPATLRAIRDADAPWAGIPVIALTAEALCEKREEYMALGLGGLVPKPVDKRLLWSEILTAVPPPPPL